MIHPLSWLAWVAAALIALSTTRNPLYVILQVMCISLVVMAVDARQDSRPAPFSPLKFALLAIAGAAILNGLTVHFGDHVIFTIPGRLPYLSGDVTWEAVVYGALNGLVLSGLFAAFAVINMALPIAAFVQLIPRAFHTVAIIISISVTFVPVTLRQFQQIREAQAVRGHRARGLRDWAPLFLPLLTSGIEHALQLAEAMTARGFASTNAAPTWTGFSILGGMTALLAGWLATMLVAPPAIGYGLLALGAMLILLALIVVSRLTPHTVYRPRAWRAPDAITAAAMLAIMVLFAVGIPGVERESLYYYPYPSITWPRFEPTYGLAALGLLVPLAFVHKESA